MYFVGLDAHTGQSNFCMMDERGHVVKEQCVRGGIDTVLDRLATLPGR